MISFLNGLGMYYVRTFVYKFKIFGNLTHRNIFCFQDIIIPWASAIFVELYIEDGMEPYISMSFIETVGIKTIQPVRMSIPDCGFRCPLKDMYRLFNNILPTRSFEDECA